MWKHKVGFKNLGLDGKKDLQYIIAILTTNRVDGLERMTSQLNNHKRLMGFLIFHNRDQYYDDLNLLCRVATGFI